mmetsp:Transcript_108885/g.318625  ORF Transcript_108885/g.318625 Transcript_108885/m.318625 type:complete len:627 (-) Transcript_108885:88-1968(-)
MSAGPTGSLGLGFGYAATLIQFHLGIGLVLLILASTAGSIPALHRQLQGTSWQAGLKAAAAAAGPSPLLAVFALIQASSARSDLLTWVGLLASTSAVMLGSLHAVLCCCFGLDPPAIHPRTGDIVSAPIAEEVRLARCFSLMARMLNSLRAFGHALLIMASPPDGMQLLCASALLRLSLGVCALSAGAKALALTPGSSATAGTLRDAEKVTGATPLIGSLALMDYIVFGSGSMLLTPVHPILHSTLLVIAQVGLVLAVRTSLNGSIEESEQAELDFRVHIGKRKTDSNIGLPVERFRSLIVTCLHATMAISITRILAGTLSVDASTTGFSVEWGEPLFATASLLAALLIVIHVAEIVLATASAAGSSEASAAHMNGFESPEAASEATPETPSIMRHVKALVMPVHSLIVGLLIVRMQALEHSDSGILSSSAALPLRYGFIIAAAAVCMQLGLLAASVLSGVDVTQTPELPLDGRTSAHYSSAVACLRQGTLLCLLGGLVMGCASMGIRLWLVLGITVGPCTYIAIPADARKTFREILAMLGGSVKETADYLASCAQAYMKQRQYEMEVQHARKADEMAAEVERELGTVPTEAKGSKAPKGLKAKAAPAPPETKVSKAKSASKPRRR